MTLLLHPCRIVGSKFQEGQMQFRVTDHEDTLLYESQLIDGGNPVIADFYGIAKAQELLDKEGTFLPVYASNKAAIKWAREQQHNSSEPHPFLDVVCKKLSSFDKELLLIFHWDKQGFNKENPAKYSPTQSKLL